MNAKERMARAIQRCNGPSSWDDLPSILRADYLRQAEALQADLDAAGLVIVQREPTEKMDDLNAEYQRGYSEGWDVAHEPAPCGHARANWKDPEYGTDDYKGNEVCEFCDALEAKDEEIKNKENERLVFEDQLNKYIEKVKAKDAEIAGWRECALYDACMDGPKFRVWDRSALDRMRRKAEVSIKATSFITEGA